MKNKRLTRILCMILVFALVLPMIPSDLSFGFAIRAHAEDFRSDIIQETEPSEPDPAPEPDDAEPKEPDTSGEEEAEWTDAGTDPETADQDADNEPVDPERSGSSGPDTEYYDAPYRYGGDNEEIILNTGRIGMKIIDYTLPGKDGLDVVIGRYYDSASSSGTASDHLYYYNNPFRIGNGWGLLFPHLSFVIGSDYVYLKHPGEMSIGFIISEEEYSYNSIDSIDHTDSFMQTVYSRFFNIPAE